MGQSLQGQQSGGAGGESHGSMTLRGDNANKLAFHDHTLSLPSFSRSPSLSLFLFLSISLSLISPPLTPL